MFWMQAGLSFVLWLGLGLWQVRRGDSLYGFVSTLPRSRRIVGAIAAFLLALVVLFAPLGYMLRIGGFGNAVMAPLAWLTVSIVGLVFVALQTFATAMLATLAREAAVTTGASSASTYRDRPL